MISTKADAIGIIFPNSYDGLVPELVTERLMASIPFAGRYRLCDFMISSMVQSGIDDISLMVRKNYRSLMDHLGSGREWDLARKKGGLNIVPPYSQKSVGAYFGRIEALKGLLGYLRKHNEEYVIITDSNVVVNFNFRDLIKKHVDSGADITAVYRRMPIPASLNRPSEENGELYYSFEIENDFVKKVYINPSDSGDVNFNLNMYILGREKLIELVEDAYVHGATYFARDIIIPQLDRLSVQAYHYDGYLAHIHDMKSYFDENMRLLEDENLNALFSGNRIYTKIRDDNPTRYLDGAFANNVLVADGCIIEGHIENSILFRGVKVKKGAVVKNCILMQDTVVEENADIEYVITDKNVRITKDNRLVGNDSYQVFVSKGCIV